MSNIQKKINNIENSIENCKKNISLQTIKKRNERQEHNNELAYNSIKLNLKHSNNNNINNKALIRLLKYTKYNNLDEIIKDKNNHEENIIKLVSLYISKNASRQGMKDEKLQLENINNLHEYDITIIKDGKQKPIKGGGIRKSKLKQSDELKSIDFIIKYKTNEIGYITAKVSSGSGGHQDNVLEEITQFCDWSLIQQKNDKERKVYIVLYDSMNTSKLFNDIIKKYKNTNLILTNTSNFKINFLNWFLSKN